MVEDEVGVVIHGNIYVLWQPLYIQDGWSLTYMLVTILDTENAARD